MQSPQATPDLETAATEMVQILLDSTDKRHSLYLKELNKVLHIIDMDLIKENDPEWVLHFIQHVSGTELDIVDFTHKVRETYISTLDREKDADKIAKIEKALELLEQWKLQTIIEHTKEVIWAIVWAKTRKNIQYALIWFALATLLAALWYIK